MLLSSGHNQVIAFFDVCAADVLAMRPTFLIVGDVGLSGFEIIDQFIEFFDVLRLRVILFQNIQSLLNLAAPKLFEQQAQVQEALDILEEYHPQAKNIEK